MHYLRPIVCSLASFVVFPSILVGQYEPYGGGDFSPYGNSSPAFDNSSPAYGNSSPAFDNRVPENELRNAPGGMRWNSDTPTAEPWYQPAPPDSAYRPERAASYAPEQASPYDRPTQDFGGGTLPPWGPPPDVYSIAPEGMRRPAPPPARPQAEPAPPLNANPAASPASEGGSQDVPNEPQNEFFEPDPDDLKEDYLWYQPSTWEDFGWDTTIELGMNGSAGNSRTNSLKAGFKAERETEIYKFLFDVVHNRAATEDVSTQNNVLSKLRLDRKLGESRWSLFAQGYGEYDEFKDFDARLVGNLGATYMFLKTETTKLSGDFGSGVSHEIGGFDDSYTPEAVFGLDFKHQLSKRQKLYAKCDFFPDWGDWSSYRVVTDTGWELLLDEEWGLNLKIGVIDRYDSTPGSRKPNDLDYSMLLLWKL